MISDHKKNFYIQLQMPAQQKKGLREDWRAAAQRRQNTIIGYEINLLGIIVIWRLHSKN